MTAEEARLASLTPACRGPKPPPQAWISAGPAVYGTVYHTARKPRHSSPAVTGRPSGGEG